MVVCPEEVLLEEVHLEEAPLEGVGQEGVDPLEEALGPMGLEGHPRVVEGLVVQVGLEGQVDPRLLAPCTLPASVANLPLPSSRQGPSEGGHHQGEDPRLGAPWGPSLVVAHVVPSNQVVVVHVVPKNQVAAVRTVPSLREEDTSLHVGPAPSLEEEGPSQGQDLWAP